MVCRKKARGVSYRSIVVRRADGVFVVAAIVTLVNLHILYKHLILKVVIPCFAGMVLASHALALDAASGDDPPLEPLKTIESVVEATRNAIRSYLAGNKEEAVKSLEIAADQGHAPAQWKLGRMYADGDGVEQDDAKAFENFSRVCDRHADEPPDSPTAPFVSSAFIALGSYYLSGIPHGSVKSDPVRAREMFTYSASYFGDASAQYILARLYLDGIGGQKDVRQAVRWFNLSAEKGNRLSQATLGKLLFTGEAGARQRARGLMWLTLASENADPAKEAWIIEALEEATDKASDSDRLAAAAYLKQRKKSIK